MIVNSELLVSNGGTKVGVTTLYVHADFSAPVVGAIVTAVKVNYKGRNVSILTAKCPDGKLQAKAKAVFFNYETSETTTASAEIIRTCTGKG